MDQHVLAMALCGRFILPAHSAIVHGLLRFSLRSHIAPRLPTETHTTAYKY